MLLVSLLSLPESARSFFRFRAHTTTVHATDCKIYVSSSSSTQQPVAQDENLRRITVSNDDGDVYVESSGDGSEIVLKTEKVRVTDGDVYFGESRIGLSTHLDSLNTKIDAVSLRVDNLNDTEIALSSDLVAINTTVMHRVKSFDESLESLRGSDTRLKLADDGIAVRLGALNSTSQALKSAEASLSTQISALRPPKCALPGGAKLRHDGIDWICVCNDSYSGPTCEEFELPTLTHWFDFSRLGSQSIESLQSFQDLKGNATDLEVIGQVRYDVNVQNTLGAVYFHEDREPTPLLRTLRFRSNKLGRNPEVFVVFKVLKYSANGVIIGDVNNGYGFGTYGAGDGRVGVPRTNGQFCNDET